MPDPDREVQSELPLFEAEPSAASNDSSTSQGALSRNFLGWSEPLLSSAVDHLTREWDTSEPLDLSTQLLVVPTRNAGRRLRESLAIRAGEFDSAVFPPTVVTQDYLISTDRLLESNLTLPVAGTQITLWIWAALLLKLPLNRFRQAFPVDPVERTLKWACDTAGELLQVRHLLTESGHIFATAAEVLAAQDMEPGRWAELARIEQLAIADTEKCGLADEASAQLKVPGNGQLNTTVESITVCGLTDLRPLAEDTLKHWSSTYPVELLIHAPESEAPHFDSYGRPLPTSWIDRSIPIPDPNTIIQNASTPLEQAELTADLLNELDQVSASAAIGIPDTALSTPLQETLKTRGLKSYDPAGRALAGEGIYYLIKQVAEVTSSQTISSFRRLLNCPGVGNAILRDIPTQENFTTCQLLQLSDKLIIETLPSHLDDALESARRRFYTHPELARAIEWIQNWSRRFQKDSFDSTLNEFLAAIYEGRQFSNHDPAQSILSEVADAIQLLNDDLDRVAATFPKAPSASDRFEMLLTTMSTQQIYPEREPEEVDLQGWLELLWEDAPRLVVTGMNDHSVPEAIVGHAFLPDTARRVLGVQNNDDRFARDAYFLTSMLESRKKEGRRVDLIFGRESASGDPLRPSRLLFQCPAEELPSRTLHLFRDVEIENRPEARSVAFPLKPLPLPPGNKVFERASPTSIKQYLACPFRFYLKFGLGMSSVELNKREMDAADFGNLVHNSLEAFARDAEAITLTAPEKITQFLHQEIDRQLSSQFGKDLSTPLVIQRESARKRLAWWAAIESEQRKAGWKILAPEETFGTEEWPFSIDGMTVKGRIDRIEQHPEHGIRVIDFKTFSPGSGSNRKTVDAYHLTPLKRNESPDDFPEWALIEGEDGKTYRWTDLQLPLYLLAMSERENSARLTAAYATLGKSEAEVSIDEWSELDDRLLDSARACATGVIKAINQQIFWPASEDAPPWDDFRDLLQPTAQDTVDSTGLTPSLNPV